MTRARILGRWPGWIVQPPSHTPPCPRVSRSLASLHFHAENIHRSASMLTLPNLLPFTSLSISHLLAFSYGCWVLEYPAAAPIVLRFSDFISLPFSGPLSVTVYVKPFSCACPNSLLACSYGLFWKPIWCLPMLLCWACASVSLLRRALSFFSLPYYFL